MKSSNSVFIATSLDGYIADANGGIDWLHSIPNPDGDDMGYADFMNRIDALVMGRNTFEIVLGFDMDWPYTKPVFVLSNSLKDVPTELSEKVFIVRGSLNKVLHEIHQKGHHHLYIDGGKTIQSFLQEDLIDEIIITQIPLLLGDGIRLFSGLDKPLRFMCEKTMIYLSKVVQNHYMRDRSN